MFKKPKIHPMNNSIEIKEFKQEMSKVKWANPIAKPQSPLHGVRFDFAKPKTLKTYPEMQEESFCSKLTKCFKRG